MEEFVLMKQGAEAKLYKGIFYGKPAIAKVRFQKKYRHEHLDNSLTKERITAEIRAIIRCKTFGIRTPAIYSVNFKTRVIVMEYFEHSTTVKEFIEHLTISSSLELLLKLSILIGKIIGSLHQCNIIHGDLTTSNILLVNKHNKDNFSSLEDLDIVLIDFGLAHVDNSSEDKGVDLYVLERALMSTHSVAEKLFPKILEGYQESHKYGGNEVLLKYEEVRARGRKRTMIG